MTSVNDLHGSEMFRRCISREEVSEDAFLPYTFLIIQKKGDSSPVSLFRLGQLSGECYSLVS